MFASRRHIINPALFDRMLGGAIALWACLFVVPVDEAGAGDQSKTSSVYRRAKAATVLIVAVEDEPSGLSMGSGVFINGEGAILTSAHVIAGATRLYVYDADGVVHAFPHIVAQDVDRDLAVIHVEAISPAYLSMGTDDPEEGMDAIAVGYPRIADELRMGMALHATTFPVTVVGEVLGRTRISRTPYEFLQVTGLVNAGNSGGPLVSIENGTLGGVVVQAVPYAEPARGLQGETVGSVTMRAGVGYCIPVQHVRAWVQSLPLPSLGARGSTGEQAKPMLGAATEARIYRTVPATGHLLHLMAGVLRHDPALLDLAIHHYESFLRLEPGRVDVLRNLSAALAARGKLELARMRIEDALAMAPTDVRLLTHAGDLSYGAQDQVKAEQYYRRATLQDPCYFPASIRLLSISRMRRTAASMSASSEDIRTPWCSPPPVIRVYQIGMELVEMGLMSEALHLWDEFEKVAHDPMEKDDPLWSGLRLKVARLHMQLRSSPDNSSHVNDLTPKTALAPLP